MTRINLVDPKVLSDKHLLAEYHELPRIFTAVEELVTKGKTPADVEIPPTYRLGKGHMKFFYNKLDWLACRWEYLHDTLILRGFRLEQSSDEMIRRVVLLPREWRGKLFPTPEEVYLNMARLVKRSKMPAVLEELNAD